MTLSKRLDLLERRGAYPGSYRASVRWGQLLRGHSNIEATCSQLREVDKLIALRNLGKIRGGVVTRANAFFLVREIPFDEIPARMRVTRGDLRTHAVVMDGLGVISRIERDYLRSVVKGPESLESAFQIRRNDIRLFDIKCDKAELVARHANGALAYLRRGETVAYKTSDDDLKGGIPAQRSQVKNRRPHWYSIQGEQKTCAKIVFPEHFDGRYVFTLMGEDDQSIVIDKLYLFEPTDPRECRIVHVALNSLLTWYQVELRGRSQMGEGVLEAKIPDFEGLSVLNPSAVNASQRRALVTKFEQIPSPASGQSLSELGTSARYEFDLAYLRACGFAKPDVMLLRLEQALRALAGERTERKLSVLEARIGRRGITNVAASVDAYAARLAAQVRPFPDPREYVVETVSMQTVTVGGEVTGVLEVGAELFNQGEVIAGGICIAKAGDMLSAQFVLHVLLIQPDLKQIDVPKGKYLSKTMADWDRDSRAWHRDFTNALERVLLGVEDKRTRSSIQQRALKLLHAV